MKEGRPNTSKTPIEFTVLQSEVKTLQFPNDQDVFFTKAELVNISPDSIGKTVKLSVEYNVLYFRSDQDDILDDASNGIGSIEQTPKTSREHIDYSFVISAESNVKTVSIQLCPEMNPEIHVIGVADVILKGVTAPSGIFDEEEEESEIDSDMDNHSDAAVNENDNDKNRGGNTKKSGGNDGGNEGGYKDSEKSAKDDK